MRKVLGAGAILILAACGSSSSPSGDVEFILESCAPASFRASGADSFSCEATLRTTDGGTATIQSARVTGTLPEGLVTYTSPSLAGLEGLAFDDDGLDIFWSIASDPPEGGISPGTYPAKLEVTYTKDGSTETIGVSWSATVVADPA